MRPQNTPKNTSERRITCINGSLGGSSGNTARVLDGLLKRLAPRAELDVVHLAEGVPSDLELRLDASDGFVFSSGTYWDSWGSPLQKFLEDFTALEASPVWMGKPAAVVITMHSVGGKEVLSRLQGVLCTLGLTLPPMSGFVYSLANHLALQLPESEWQDDLWQLNDLSLIADNLLLAAATRQTWASWPVDRADPRRLWLPSVSE